MEIYIKNEKGELKETDFRDLLYERFYSNKELFDGLENNQFSDGSSRWFEIKKRNFGETKEFSISIEFADDFNSITGFEIYESNIKKIVDDSNAKKLV